MLDNGWKPLNKGKRNMKYDLEPVKEVLRAFLKDVEDTKGIRKKISKPQPARSFIIKDKMPEFDASEFNFAYLTESSYFKCVVNQSKFAFITALVIFGVIGKWYILG